MSDLLAGLKFPYTVRTETIAARVQRSGADTLLEQTKFLIEFLSRGVEVAAAVIIGLAAAEATLKALRIFLFRNSPPEAKTEVRLTLGRWLAVALEFELAADVLRTAVAPTWNEIGQLAAIAALRTALNYFLGKEIDQEASSQRQQAESALPKVSDVGGDGPPRSERISPRE